MPYICGTGIFHGFCLTSVIFRFKMHSMVNIPVRYETNTNSHDILKIQDAALYLEMSEDTVYKLAGAGEIPATKVGGGWRFLRSKLDAWIAERIDRETESRKRAAELLAGSGQ